MNALEQALDIHGFRQYETTNALTHPHATSGWQQRILNGDGVTLYFINAFYYRGNGLARKHTIEFEADLYPSLTPDNRLWSILELHGSKTSEDIEIAIIFFRHAYDKLGCKPDPHN